MFDKTWKKVVWGVLVIIVALGCFVRYDFRKFCDESVPIFAYHRVGDYGNIYSMPVKELDAQMKYMHDQGYRTLNLDQYVKARENHEKLYRTMVLTFDDGYSDNLSAGVPVLSKYGYTASIFLAIKFMAWPDYVTWEDVQGLEKAGWEIGSHTYNHIELGKASPDVVLQELVESKEFLTKGAVPYPVSSLCFPSGSFNKNVCKLVKEAGYKAALTGDIGVNSDNIPLTRLRRVNAFYYGPGIEGFAHKLEQAQVVSYVEKYGIDGTKWWRKYLKWTMK